MRVARVSAYEWSVVLGALVAIAAGVAIGRSGMNVWEWLVFMVVTFLLLGLVFGVGRGCERRQIKSDLESVMTAAEVQGILNRLGAEHLTAAARNHELHTNNFNLKDPSLSYREAQAEQERTHRVYWTAYGLLPHVEPVNPDPSHQPAGQPL